jgi:2-keto-4-pentenoate hydratase/2-oxohepta-3-ene-1,7-dioic acid hydratase in catechol pathway
MRLCTYRKGRGAPRLGAVMTGPAGEAVIDLTAAADALAVERGAIRRGRGFPRTMLELIAGGADALALAREALEHGRTILEREGMDALAARALGVARARARLEAPIPRPARNVFCLGRNYAAHAAERGADAPVDPVYFTKPPECVIAPGAGVVHHAVTRQLDYEVELTAVIGTGGRDIARADALGHVFGYTVVNDVTARDLQKRHGQWFKGKSLDTFCPMGPVLVTADEIADPQALAIALRVNGETRQSSNTATMIFPVAQCIEVLSQGFTLRPGDVIATGTPEGVGAASGRFLAVGDRMEAEVEKIGILANPIVAPPAAAPSAP